MTLTTRLHQPIVCSAGRLLQQLSPQGEGRVGLHQVGVVLSGSPRLESRSKGL